MEFSFSALPCHSRSTCVVLSLRRQENKLPLTLDSVQTAEKGGGQTSEKSAPSVCTIGLHLALVHLRHNGMHISKGGEVQGCIWLLFPFLLRFFFFTHALLPQPA